MSSQRDLGRLGSHPMIVVGLVIAGAAAGVLAYSVHATRRVIKLGAPPRMFPGVEPDDVEELASSMERTAHLYRGFGREREAHRAVRVLHRTGRNRPRVWTMSTLECRTLGRSTWFRLEDGTAVRVDDPIALVSGDELPMGDVPENVLHDAQLVAAQRSSGEIVLQFRDAGLHLELRGTGAAIL